MTAYHMRRLEPRERRPAANPFSSVAPPRPLTEEQSVNSPTESAATPLFLRVGELVEVREAAEILATLDEKGELDGLPFMPEMLRFCGRQLRVYRSAHKTCDTITGQLVSRRMEHCVHLEGVRCDGGAHGGCQAGCLMFWKEAWLRRVEPDRSGVVWRLLSDSSEPGAARAGKAGCTPGDLERQTVRSGAPNAPDATYRCQVTQLIAASRPLPWWEPRQYLQDWLSGNWSLGSVLRTVLLRAAYRLVLLWRGYRVKIKAYDALARLLGEPAWPYSVGTLTGPTPSESSGFQPGDWVEVKSHQEILATLRGQKNRGMGFAPEMVRYCGGRYRVRSRVENIIDERTGKMMRMSNDCLILEDVICRSECSERRLFCPRSIYPFWREIWLRRFPREPASRAQGG